MAGVNFTITRNDIAPALARMASKAKNPSTVFRAMGTTFKSITEGNFNSVGAALRAKPWPAKKDGRVATLKKKGVLASSFHLEVTSTYAKLKNPTIYAAVHQLGSRKAVAGKKTGTVKSKFRNSRAQDILSGGKGTPPRPFYPVDAAGKLTPASETLIARAGERALARDLGAQ